MTGVVSRQCAQRCTGLIRVLQATGEMEEEALADLGDRNALALSTALSKFERWGGVVGTCPR